MNQLQNGKLNSYSLLFRQVQASPTSPRALPLGAVVDHPIDQRTFKADVAPRLLGFNPSVFEDFLLFSQKLPVE